MTTIKMKGLLALTAIFAVYLHVEAVKLIRSGATCVEKQAAIDAHNTVRMKLANGLVERQPKASNMNRLVWDDALAEIAQNWANEMQFEHNPNRNDDRFYVGENIYTSMSMFGSKNPEDPSNKPDFPSAVKSWFDEHRYYKYGPYEFDEQTGHYTQVAWANTIYVGCGYVSFVDEDDFYQKITICDYGPGGNMEDEYVYRVGEGCENLCCQEQCILPATGAICNA